MSAYRIFIVAALALPVMACESDPHRFERWGGAVADIRLSSADVRSHDAPPAPDNVRGAVASGLRPAMQVEVVDPMQLWAARDGGLRGAAEVLTPAVAAGAAQAVQRAALRPAAEPGPRPKASSLVQLGAFSSQAAAEAAWGRLSRRAGLSGLTPRYERVAGDKPLVRLKVAVAQGAAAEVCRAAGVADRWCASTGR